MAIPSRTPIDAGPAENRRAAAEMVLAALAFATMSAIAHGFRGVLPWPVVAFARISVTCVIMHVLLRLNGLPLPLRDRALWWRSVFGTAGLLCNFYALSRLPVTDVVTILATSPVWVTVILATVLRRPMPRVVWLHAGLAVAGVYVMHRPTFEAAAVPLFIALGAAIVIAAAKVSLSYCAHLHPLSVVTHYASFGAVATLIMSLTVTDANVGAGGPALGPWGWLVAMGLAGTAAQLLMTLAYTRGTTTMVAVVGLSQIAFSAVYDRVLWGHTLDTWKVAGIAMVAVAITWSVRSAGRLAA